MTLMLGGKAHCARVLPLALLGALGACSAEAPRDQHSARAASAVVISPPTLHNNTGPIPGNGSLLMWSQFGGMPTVEVRPVSAPETPIAGSVHELEGYWVWTADSTMPEGMYEVLIQGTGFGSSTEFIEVTAPRAFAKPALMSSPIATMNDRIAEVACCMQLVDPVRVAASCFGISTGNFVLLTPGVSTTEPASALTQLLFEIRAHDQPPLAQADLFRGDLEPVYFDEQADEYCFDLAVTEIATGEQYVFDELVLCAPHGDQPDFGIFPLEANDSDLDRFVCPAPPAGYEERWCALNEAPCAAAPASPGCEAAGHVCRGEPLPNPTTGGTTGSAGASGASGSAGVAGRDADPIGGGGDTAGTGSGGSASRPAKHVTACSAGPRRAPASWGPLALLGAGLGLLWSRRRAR